MWKGKVLTEMRILLQTTQQLLIDWDITKLEQLAHKVLAGGHRKAQVGKKVVITWTTWGLPAQQRRERATTKGPWFKATSGEIQNGPNL